MGFSSSSSHTLAFGLIILLLSSKGLSGATFTFVNRCDFTVWPGILANAGSPRLDTTGFELPQGTSRTMQAPTGWSGRFWARTGCKFDGSGTGSCSTGDCGSGLMECNGLGAAPPVTLAEFTLGTGGQDFYDVSLVDGYNLQMVVEGSGRSGQCTSTGCTTDLNRQCPAELRVGDGNACKSACEAFHSPQYCCSGAYGTPDTCRPSVYSEMFKSACPRSYSYAYDDATSTFTCNGADYTVTFCPSSPSQKSTSYATPVTGSSASQVSDPGSGSEMGFSSLGYDSPSTGTGSGYPVTGSGSGYPGTGSGSGYPDTGSGSGYPGTGSGSGYSVTGSGSVSGETTLENGPWLAGLAMGDSSRTGTSFSATLLMAFTTLYLVFSFLCL